MSKPAEWRKQAELHRRLAVSLCEMAESYEQLDASLPQPSEPAPQSVEKCDCKKGCPKCNPLAHCQKCGEFMGHGHECKPAPAKVDAPRRMQGNSASFGRPSRHATEHDFSPGCETNPPCQPVAPTAAQPHNECPHGRIGHCHHCDQEPTAAQPEAPRRRWIVEECDVADGDFITVRNDAVFLFRAPVKMIRELKPIDAADLAEKLRVHFEGKLWSWRSTAEFMLRELGHTVDADRGERE